MGIEKLVPRARDLGVFLRLLARSGTGQAITTYTTHFHGPIAGGELHVVIVDNGRSGILRQEPFRPVLRCIRCGACMNTCPVYRRSGGFSYGYLIPGPLGSVLAPHRDPAAHASLPFASTLCGSCDDVCPVRIDLHEQLLAWRRELGRRGLLPWRKRVGMALGSIVLRHAWLYRLAGRVARALGRAFPGVVRTTAWGRARELPEPPRETFRDLWRRRRP
jgi:L-lactate dehydrogenase complex protein LldF